MCDIYDKVGVINNLYINNLLNLKKSHKNKFQLLIANL